MSNIRYHRKRNGTIRTLAKLRTRVVNREDTPIEKHHIQEDCTESSHKMTRFGEIGSVDANIKRDHAIKLELRPNLVKKKKRNATGRPRPNPTFQLKEFEPRSPKEQLSAPIDTK